MARILATKWFTGFHTQGVFGIVKTQYEDEIIYYWGYIAPPGEPASDMYKRLTNNSEVGDIKKIIDFGQRVPAEEVKAFFDE